MTLMQPVRRAPEDPTKPGYLRLPDIPLLSEEEFEASLARPLAEPSPAEQIIELADVAWAGTVTRPWQAPIPKRPGESWLEHQARQYAQWKAPFGVKGVTEFLNPIYWAPAFGGVGRAAKVAKTAGATAKTFGAAARAAEEAIWATRTASAAPKVTPIVERVTARATPKVAPIAERVSAKAPPKAPAVGEAPAIEELLKTARVMAPDEALAASNASKLRDLRTRLTPKQMQELTLQPPEVIGNIAGYTSRNTFRKDLLQAQARVAARGGEAGFIHPFGRPEPFKVPVEPGSPLAKVEEMWAATAGKKVGVWERITAAETAIERQLTDKFAAENKIAGRLRREWKKEFPGQEFPIELDIDVHVATLAGAPSAATQRVREAYTTVKAILGRDVSVDHVDDYLNLRHALDIQKMHPERKIAGGLANVEEVNLALRQLAEGLGPERLQKVEKAAAVIRDAYADGLERMVDSGLVSTAMAGTLRQQYPWYNRMRYVHHLAEQVEGTGGKAISVNKSGIQRLSEFGSEAARERPTDSFVMATLQTDMLIARNNAAKAIIKAAEKDAALAGQINKVKGVRPVAQVEGELVFRPTKGEIRGTVSFMENGTRQIYEVPAWLERDMKAMSNIETGLLPKLLSAVQAVPRAGLTGANPVFFLGNLAIDTLTAMTTQGVSPGRVLKRLAVNIKNLRSADPMMAQYLKLGGGMSGFSGKTPQQLVKQLSKEGQIAIHTEGDWRKIFTSPLDTLFRLGHAVEMAPRTATFELALKRGADPLRAMLAGRRVTVDFARGGQLVQLLNTAFLYMNPAVQGTMIPARALRDFPRSRYWLAGFMGAKLGTYAWNRQFPEYADVPTWSKFNTWMIMLPSDEYDKRGNKVPHYISIVPNLREFAFFSAPLEYALGKLDGTVPEEMDEFLQAWLSSINPFGQILGTTGLPIPTQLAETIVELRLNHDTFRNQPIVPPEQEGLPAGEQFNKWTSETARRAGEFSGISPLKLQYFVRNVFGGLGTMVMGGMDKALHEARPEIVHENIVVLTEQLAAIKSPEVAPDDIPLERDKFLSRLTPEIRDEVLKQERKPEPAWPFISDMVNKIYRTRGGQIYRTGLRVAEQETHLSAKDTADMGKLLGKASDTINKGQFTLNQALIAGQIQGVTGLEPYTPEMWREDHTESSKFYGTALALGQILYPGAAQVQEDPDAWANWQAHVYTLAGAIPDTRLRGQILLAAYYQIQPEGPTPSTMDWGTFFARREQFRNGLDSSDRRLLESWIESSHTDVEKFYYDSIEKIRPYWNIQDKLFATYPRAKEVDILLRQPMPDSLRNVLEADTEYKKYQRILSTGRDLYRTSFPEVDALLIYWGYGPTKEKTPEATNILNGLRQGRQFVAPNI